MESDILVHILDGREEPKNLPFALLKNITDNFSEDRVIGEGGFAIVYEGVLPNRSVAVKRIRNNHTIDEKLFYREVSSVLLTNHRNVVRFLGFCASTEQGAIKNEGSRLPQYFEIRERLLCFEYISNGNLKKHITDELRGLEWNTRYQIIKAICEGLHYLHKEKHIYHMDLKPANILLDDYMVPKIADFGLSRLDDKSQTMSESRYGTRVYCAPEYLDSGKMSFKSDMFSLGIIITELVTGDKRIPDNDKNNVLRRWRHRWKKTGKETPLAYQQVAKCMEIGLLCQKIDPLKRPFIWDVMHDIRKMDSVNDTISNACEYTFGQISPYSEDDMLGVEPLELHFPFELNRQISSILRLTNQTDAYIAFNIQKMSPLSYCMQPTKDIVLPRSECSVSITLHSQDKAPRDMQRADEFIVWSTKVNDGLTAEDITINMFSKEGGVVDATNLDVVFNAEESTKVSKELIPGSITEDMSNNEKDCTMGDVNKSQECLLPTALWTSSTGNQNHQEAMESSEPQQASDKSSEMRAHEELWPDMQSTDKLLVNPNTTASKNLAPHSVTGEMLIDKTDDKVADEAKSDESLPPMPNFSESSGIQDYQEVAEEFSEPQSAHDTTYETKVIPGSSMIIDVHPPELCFHFGPNGLIACSLDLTNNTDAIMAFGVKDNNKDRYFSYGSPVYGIVDPRTTYTLVLIVDTHYRFLLLPGRSVNLILQTSTYCKSSTDVETCAEHFQNAEQLGITVHQVTLKGVCPLQGKTIFELIPHSIKIISVTDNYTMEGNAIMSMDANQTEPLIITTGCVTGHVDIWNYDTQEYTGFIKTQEGLLGKLFGFPYVWCIKFIARMGWFVVGADDVISVYNYKNTIQKVTSFKANSPVLSLAIHPTQPYALSTCEKEIQLWAWGRFGSKWKCMQVFKEQSDLVFILAFNPEDHDSFASGYHDGTIKVWTLDSPTYKYTLSGHSGRVRCMEFFTRDGQQYLITGSADKTAKIWDMQMKECVHTLHHRSEVRSVLPHPTLPVLVTGTEDGLVYLWSSINFRLKRILNIHVRSCVQGLACLNESGRVVVAHLDGLSIIEISDEEEQGGSNYDTSVSATD